MPAAATTRKRTTAPRARKTAAPPTPDPLAGIVPPDPDVHDFSIQYKPVRFRFNGPDVFEAVPVLPAPVLRSLGRLQAEMAELPVDKKLDKMLSMFDVLLQPASAARFRQRLESLEDPDGGGAVDVNQQVMPALQLLMEKVGKRPTLAAGSSSDGLSSIGDLSTAGAPPEDLTRKRSARIVSSTSSTT